MEVYQNITVETYSSPYKPEFTDKYNRKICGEGIS